MILHGLLIATGMVGIHLLEDKQQKQYCRVKDMMLFLPCAVGPFCGVTFTAAGMCIYPAACASALAQSFHGWQSIWWVLGRLIRF